MTSIAELEDKLGRFVDRGSSILQSYGDVSKEITPVRRFKGDEMARLAGVSNPRVIYQAQKEGRLPPPQLSERNTRLGATLSEINMMQDVFRTSPRRKDDEPAVCLSFTNFKGGCWKTTTSLYAATCWANQGYRVLLVDLDPQSSLTQQVGILSDIETTHEMTLGPKIVDEVTLLGATELVKDTYCENLKIIPSSLDLAGAEFVLAQQLLSGDYSQLEVFYRLRNALDEVKNDYDIVIVDGTPSLGILPINIILGADSVVVPVPTEMVDYASTVSFCSLFQTQLEVLRENFGIEDETAPDVFFLPTRFDPSLQNSPMSCELVLDDIQATFEGASLNVVIKKHGIVSNLAPWGRTVFDVNGGDLGLNRESRKRAITNFTAVFDEVLRRAVFPHWKSKMIEQGVI